MKFSQAEKLLAGEEAVVIVTQRLPELILALPAQLMVYILDQDTKHPYGVISNRSQYTVETDMVVAGGEWELHARGIMIRRMRGTTAYIEPDPVRGEMTLKNLNTMPCTIRLMLPNGKSHRVHAGGRSTLIITPADMALN